MGILKLKDKLNEEIKRKRLAYVDEPWYVQWYVKPEIVGLEMALKMVNNEIRNMKRRGESHLL
jgi:hypothetical protein